MPNVLDFNASVLAGKGVGRYGSAGEPDATANPNNGSLTPLKGTHYLIGLQLHVDSAWTFMAYAGREQVDSQPYDLTYKGVLYGYGYGNPLFSDANCDVEGGVSCSGNTASIKSVTIGGWWKFYRSPSVGFMELGLTDTYVRRDAFGGVAATASTFVTPSTNINIILMSFRYYPFQK